MGLFERLFGKKNKISDVGKQDETKSREELIVEGLKSRRDYAGLATFITNGEEYDYSLDFFSAGKSARYALCDAGNDAVPVVIEEIHSAHQAWRSGLDDLAGVLCDIGDPRAVPVLRQLIEDGTFSHSPNTVDKIERFVEKWPDLQTPSRMVKCLLCGERFELKDTEGYGQDGKEYRLCLSCWPKRAEWLTRIQEEDPAPYQRRRTD